MSLVIPDAVLVWKFGGEAGSLRSQHEYSTNSGYNMKCRANGKYLTWAKQTFGVNLDFTTDSAVRKVHFALPDKKDRPILSGEPVALGIGGSPAFLKYAKRPVGINLEWSESPVYEWRILGKSGKDGEPLPTGGYLSLVNDKVDPDPDFLVFFDRPAGADIGWTTSPSFWDSLVDKATKVAIDAAKMYLKSQVGA